MAVNRVERLLRKVTGALEEAGVPYAIVGGNAVAAWVATVDEGAVRATKDVDVLLRRSDLGTAAQALARVSLDLYEVHGVYMFLTRRTPNPKTGTHVVFAGERVRESDALEAPDANCSVESAHGYQVIELHELVKMKLVAFRDIDRVHLRDMLSLNLLHDSLIQQLPDVLRDRLDEVRMPQ